MKKEAELIEFLVDKKTEIDRYNAVLEFLQKNKGKFALGDLKWIAEIASLNTQSPYFNKAFLSCNPHNVNFENFSEILKLGISPVTIIREIVNKTDASYSEYSQLLKIATQSEGVVLNYAVDAILEKRPITLDGIIELLKGWEHKHKIHIAAFSLNKFKPIDQEVLTAVLQECLLPNAGSRGVRKYFLEKISCENFTKEAYINLCGPLLAKPKPMAAGQDVANLDCNENEWCIEQLERFFVKTKEAMKMSWLLESVVGPLINAENFGNLERKAVVKLVTAFLGAKNAEIGPKSLDAILKYYHDDRNPDPEFYFQKTVESLFAVIRNDKITGEELKFVLSNLRGDEGDRCRVAEDLLKRNEAIRGKKIAPEIVQILCEMPRSEVNLVASSVLVSSDRGKGLYNPS